MKKWVWVRRFSQVFFLFLFIYILWSTTYPLKGLISPEIIFKIDPLIVFLTSLSERVLLPGLLFSLGMILMTVVFGRSFCGWVCPLGTLIDWTGASGLSKRELRDKTNTRIRKIKYFILALVTVFAVCGIQIAWVFDPLVIMARFVSLNFIPTVTLGLDKIFITLIQNFNLYGTFYDFYRALKATLLGVNAYYFSNSAAIFVFFLALIASTLLLSRLWCRTLCPLGALYALTAKLAFLERKVTGCVRCGICKSDCRTGAIREDTGYAKGECILCMDCLYDCPSGATTFRWRPRSTQAKQTAAPAKGISRKEFIFLLSSSLLLAGFKNRFRWMKGRKETLAGGVIRPPGALKENNFLDRCIRCGNCMKVCITNGLQPVTLESGLEGVWTPQLVPEIGYCEYHCTLCGNVCPTGAIPKLPEAVKQKTKLGIAHINRSLCIPWSQNESCIVCEEHCPVADKAIKVRESFAGGQKILRPSVDEVLCIGCGICQKVCPVQPVKAIRVSPQGAMRA